MHVNPTGPRGRLAIALALFLAILIPGAALSGETAPAASTRGGSISGVVEVGPEIENRRVRFPIYADLSRQSMERQEPSLDDELRNVVVYVEDVPWKGAASRPATMRQINEAFEPHVLPVVVGTEVGFPNGDPFFHNVFSLSMAGAFDLGHYPKGSSRSVTFDKAGLVKVFCHLHSDMSAVIMVLDNPFFTVPDGTGVYRIGGVPAGTYTVTAWHERARPVKRKVTIRDGETVSLDLRVPIHDQPPKD